MAVDAPDGGNIVTTTQTKSGPEADGAAMPSEASLEDWAASPTGDADVEAGGGSSTEIDAPAGGRSAEGGTTEGLAPPDAMDVCLRSGNGNPIVAATFEADDASRSRWFSFGGCGFQVTSARAHCGTHSGKCSGRTAGFQGPGYELPSAAGTYQLSAWVFQDGSSPTSLLWNVKLVCVTNGATTTTYPPASVPVSAPPKTWVLTSGAFVVPSGCTTAEVYLNQLDTAPSILPSLFADDVYIY